MNAGICFAVLLSIIGSANAGCAWPPQPAHGSYNLVQSGRSRFSRDRIPDNAVLQYTCESHYQLQNHGLRSCHMGVLSGPEEMCLVEKCPVLDSPANMIIDLEADGAVLTKAMFRCAVGYRLVGKRKIKCSLSKRWKGNVPVCVASVSCGDPGMAPNTSRDGDCCYDGNTLIYSCLSGQELIGSASITCQSDGNWSASAPHCNETSVCTAPPSTVDNGVVTTSRQVNGFMWLGENVTVACDTGYYISRGDDFDEFSGNFGDDDGGDDDDDDSAYSMYRRSKSVKCGEDGLWSSALPSCEEWRCSFPDDEISEGGRRPGNVTSLTDGQAVEYYCDAGYDMIGENRAVCNGSTFQPREFTPPRCERIQCPEIVDLENGFIFGSSFNFHDTLEFFCYDGFERLGPANRTCQETRRWSGVMVTCEPTGVQNECPDPGIPAGAIKYGSSYRVGDQVSYRCRRSEYNFVGEATLECLPSGEWSFDPPMCEDIHTFETPEEIANKLTPAWDLLKYKTSSSDLESKGRRGRFAHLLGSGLDLYFLIDTSGSMTPSAFETETQLIRKLVTEVGMGEVGDMAKTRIGLVPFSDSVNNFTMPTDISVKTVEDLVKRLIAIDHDEGGTCLTCALTYLRVTMIPTVAQVRPNSKIAAVILTDGVANVGSDPIDVATELKKDGVEIFTIGVSNTVDRDVLREVASDDSNHYQHMFTLKNYIDMDVLVGLLTTGKEDYSSCGKTKSTGRTGRIANGNKAVEGMWRWMAALYMPEPNAVTQTNLRGKVQNYKFSCGGSLINANWVLTAAHCVNKLKANEVYAKFGTEDLKKPDNAQIREVDAIKSHHDYDPVIFDNDIALLHLKSPVIPNPYVGFICLPDQPQNRLKDKMTVTGWGKTSTSGGFTITDLMETVLPSNTGEACTNFTRDAPPTHLFCLGDGRLYGESVNDTCEGDSGGPAMREIMVDPTIREYKWVQGGIVSHGRRLSCGSEGNIGVYTDLGRYPRWIKRTIQEFENES